MNTARATTETTVSVLDVAAYVLAKQGLMSVMKLEKLCYYAQAWSLVWREQPLFAERLEAWANGPVAPVLWNAHRGAWQVSSISGNPDVLTPGQKKVVDAVLKFYGDKTAQWLSDLTHAEEPWKLARERGGLAPGDRGNAEITLADMHAYYSSLQ